jgi:hypothetical protein
LITEDVVKLGTSLAAELDESDTLGRWMAHHLSDLLSRRATAPDRDEADKEIADLVLRLWAVRSAAPLRRQPYLRYTAILKTLDRIDRLASGYPFGNVDDGEPSYETGDFDRIARALEGLSGTSSAISGGLITELQLQAGSDEAAWASFSSLLSADEADEALRTLLSRMVAASEPPEERRDKLLRLIARLGEELDALRRIIETATLAAGNAEVTNPPRPRPRRRTGPS